MRAARDGGHQGCVSDPQGSESTTPPISEEETAAGSGGDLATGGDDDGAGVHDGVPLTRDAAVARDDPDDELPEKTTDDVAAIQDAGPT